MKLYKNIKAAKEAYTLSLGYGIGVDILRRWPLVRVSTMLPLFGDNKQAMLQLFGKQQFCYTTWYRAWIWFIEYEGDVYSVACSIRGTEILYYASLSKKPYHHSRTRKFAKHLAVKLR